MSPIFTLRSSFRKRAFLHAFAILACLSLSPLAQADDPPKEEPAEVNAKPYAPRKLKFRDVEEPLEMRILDLDPKLLEQRFVAKVRIKGVLDLSTDGQGRGGGMANVPLIKKMAEAVPENLRPAKEQLEMLVEQISLKPQAASPPPGAVNDKSADLIHVRHTVQSRNYFNEHFQQLKVGVTRDEKGFLHRSISPQSLLKELDRARSVPIGIIPPRELEGIGFVRIGTEFYFLAPTAEQAKSLAEAFLTLYDIGYALPSRREAARWKHAAESKLPKREAELQEASDRLDQATKDWEASKSLEALSGDAVSELRKKQLLLKIEQVGVTTRIAALEKKIADKRKSGTGVPENILSLKEEAEIDLAGLTGQLEEIERLLKVTSEKQKVDNRHISARQKVPRLEVEREIDKLVLAVYEEDYLATAPYELLDEAIPVQPIMWTPAK